MGEYGVNLLELKDVYDMDCIIIAVAHDEFKKIPINNISNMYKKNMAAKEKVLIDVKGIYSIAELVKSGLLYWRL